MKKCFKCDVNKALSDYYIHKQMADGHLNKCKECTKKDALLHRDNNLERVRAYDRSRGMLPHRVISRLAYAKTDAGKANIAKGTKKYRRENPVKYKAHSIVNYAIKAGKLFKEPCQECGTIKSVHAHHDDYSKPLNIRWLCAKHHTDWHKQNGEALNP